MEETVLTPADIIDIIKRRFWYIVIPAVLIAGIAAGVAVSIPAVFRSTATILIVDQEIPQEFVMATVNTYVEKRIESIKQRILSTTRLMEIINEFRLYRELREKATTEEVIAKMRDAIRINPISAKTKGSRDDSSTIAFTLSFEDRSPTTAQRITSKLTSVFLEENLKVREQQTKETSLFLEEEAERVKGELTELEKRLSAFKAQYSKALPALYPVNLQALKDNEREIDRLQEELLRLKDRMAFVQTQLASTPRHLETTQTQMKENRSQRLESLQEQLTFLETQFTAKHPDIIRVKSEIEELKRREQEEEGEPVEEAPTVVKSDNERYIELSSSLELMRMEKASIQRKIEDFQKKAEELRELLAVTPKIEQEYNEIIVERNSLMAKFNDLMNKTMEAKVAHGLEREQKGERFTLIDPARVPGRPIKPNRKAIFLVGIVLGLGCGVGLVALLEFADSSVRKRSTIWQTTGIPVLAAIPVLVTAQEIHARRVKYGAWVFGVIGSLIIAVIFFHVAVMDLHIFFAKVVRRLSSYGII